jgi:hypothetical protein
MKMMIVPATASTISHLDNSVAVKNVWNANWYLIFIKMSSQYKRLCLPTIRFLQFTSLIVKSQVLWQMCITKVANFLDVIHHSNLRKILRLDSVSISRWRYGLALPTGRNSLSFTWRQNLVSKTSCF